MAKTLWTGSTTVTTYGGSNGYRFDGEVIENSTSTTNNTSNVTVNLYCQGLYGFYYEGHGLPFVELKINGGTVKTQGVPNTSTSKQLICSWTGDITHNDDGTKSIRVTMYYQRNGDNSDYVPNNAKLTADPVTLTAIPRYATINSFAVSQRDETSLTYNFTSNAICDYVWYSINGGSTWNGVDITDGTGASFNVTGLSANNPYNCRLRIRRKDSQLTTDSSVVTQSTYDYPKVADNGISANPLIIGNQQTLTLYNPLSRSVTVKMYQNNTSGTQLYSGTTSGTSISFTPNATTLYNSIPNSQSGNCVYSVIYSNISTKTTGTATYKIRGDEYPTFIANDYSYSANLTSLTNNHSEVVIDNYSTISVSINTPATSSYGSTIDKYVLKWGNSTSTISSGSTGTITNGSGNTLIVTAYDKRGLPKETSKTIINVPYTSINISSISTPRVNGVDAETHLNLSGSFYNNKFGENGVQNALYSAKYYVSTTQTFSENGKSIPINEFTISNGQFSLNNYLIHANYENDGFPIGTQYYVKVEIKDGQGLLSTAIITSIVSDGKIARDVYQDSNGEYHEGINGLADSNYAETIHGELNVIGNIYINGVDLLTYIRNNS